ncbi:MAG: UvrD-helicase domain-containing protein [Gemmatimonadota bacterium]|nr:UvrD-helicase domain-containing protein [Gemmatimonadota bacterium]
MQYIADIHLHSRFARATSKTLNPENLYRWSLIKGLTVVGTGDFTHPVWFEELRDQLEPAEEGLYQLRPDLRRGIDAELPQACRGQMRFVLSVEISLIYKKNDKTRKIHHVVTMPSFDAVARLNARLGAIGNLKSDGRPILGLDSRDLVEICLEACDEVLFIPAHIWTPHFAVLGASSGFDTLEECFEDMLPHIFAVETGLSSDPPMNWRLSMLDNYAIVSNSDAHSPQKLAREATCFNTELSFRGMYDALKDRDPTRFTGTLEFYPEEGKYHFDGHRKCDICWKPVQTLDADGICPVCGRKLTVGVLHRVEKLADRAEGDRPNVAMPFENLIPLPEIIGSVLQVGPTSKRVQSVYEQMLATHGAELKILRELPIEEIAKTGDPLIAEGIRRMREGTVHIDPGYDGVYGKIQVFSDEDRARLSGQESLFHIPVSEPSKEKEEKASLDKSTETEIVRDSPFTLPTSHFQLLTSHQQAAVAMDKGPVIVTAGPGTGKTRVLTHRVIDLIQNRGVSPASVMAVTFTNRAATEMWERIVSLSSGGEELVPMRVGTFHRLSLDLLREHAPERLGAIADRGEARTVLQEAIADIDTEISVDDALSQISLYKACAEDQDIIFPELQTIYTNYQHRLTTYGLMDFDDILLILHDVLCGDILRTVQARFSHVLVDEFQDVNAVQYALIQKLAGDGSGLFVIGDPDQAIYGFRGASAEYFAQLKSDFPETNEVILQHTFRSTPQIISAASSLLGERSYDPVRENGPNLRILSTPGETGEGIAIVEEISRMVGGADLLQANEEGKRSLDDFAVLFRTGRQADALEACFLQAGIPYRVVGQKNYLDAASVQHALSFFKCLLKDNISSTPTTRDITDLLSIPAFAPGREARASIRQQIQNNTLSDTVQEKLDTAIEAVDRFRNETSHLSPSERIAKWAEEFATSDDIDIERLGLLAQGVDSIAELLEIITLGQDGDFVRRGKIARPEAVTLMTLHASKGLEFPVVFISGVEEGLIPHAEADIEEEKRLFFVGITRGQDEVILTRARSRRRFGERIAPEISRFVADIPEDIIDFVDLRTERRKPAEQLSLF